MEFIFRPLRSFTGGSWISLGFGGGNWNLGTTVNLVARRDTGGINSSPVSATSPIYVVNQGCPERINIRVADPDNDVVRCRWAVGSGECGGVCSAFPLGTLDQVGDLYTERHIHSDTDSTQI